MSSTQVIYVQGKKINYTKIVQVEQHLKHLILLKTLVQHFGA